MTAPALTFDAVFRQVRRRTVGGGPKATGADELAFIGDLGSGPLLLVSRVRLRNPQESFLTSSGHRLRDSRVGCDGHWVDLQVVGRCSDAELAAIEQLARAADEWPVRVRRARNRR